MNQALIPELQECQGLADGSVTTVRPRKAAMLVVTRGRAWVTFGAPPPPALADAGPRGGDWFLEAGDALPVTAGQSVVIEAAGHPGERLAFGWQAPGAAVRPASAPARRTRQVEARSGPRAVSQAC